jgi:hypothetical protein
MKTALMCVTVGAVLILAGCGGGDADAPEWGSLVDPPLPESAPDSLRKMSTVLAWVGDIPVTAGDVLRHMRLSAGDEAEVHRLMHNPDILQVALRALVDQLVWGQVAREEGFTVTPSDRRQLIALEAEFLATRYAAQVIEPKAFPSRKEVEALYNERQEHYLTEPRVAARHILVATEQEARELDRRVKAGEDFADLAAEFSLDERTRDIGGAVGYIQAGHEILGIGKHSGVENAVLPLEVGETTVIQTGLGWHLFRVEKREEASVRPLEEVYDELSRSLFLQRFGPMYNAELEEARIRTDTRFVEEGFYAFTGVGENADRLMQMAAEHPDPSGRIETLRRVAIDFPDSPRAPEAQFMIAYIFRVRLEDKPAARKALLRLQRQFGDSEWRQAGDWLLEHMDEDPTTFGSAEDILHRALAE